MILTESEKDSALWIKLAAHFRESLQECHKALEKTSLTADETAVIRGRIKQLRLLLTIKVEATQQLSAHDTSNTYR